MHDPALGEAHIESKAACVHGVESYSGRDLNAGTSLAHRAVVPWLGARSAHVAQVLYISPWSPGILVNAAGLAILSATKALCSAVCVLRGDLAAIVAGWDERVLDYARVGTQNEWVLFVCSPPIPAQNIRLNVYSINRPAQEPTESIRPDKHAT